MSGLAAKESKALVRQQLCIRTRRGLLRRRSEIGVISTSRVLNRDSDTIVASRTLAKVVVLEVVGLLSEPVSIRDVVDGVDNIEGIDAGGI